MLTIALTGSTGLIGSRIVQLLQNEVTFLPLSHKDCDITDKNSVIDALKNLDFDIFLHLAAYTNVDNAEHEPDVAYKLNVEATKNLFELVLQKNKKFIYMSTDFVFDGQHPPYDENSQPHPISVYGRTKYDGEQIVKDKGMIIRIAYPYGKSPAPKKDFVTSIKSLLQQEKTLHMVTDSLMTPTNIDDIAQGLNYLFQHYSQEIYHLVGPESISPYDAGKLIAKKFGLNEDLIQPITYAEYYMNKAKRPQWGKLISNTTELHNLTNIKDYLQIAE